MRKISGGRFHSWRSVPAFLLAISLFLPGCDQKSGTTIGSEPPAFSGADIHGDFVSPSRLKGKVVVIYFWADTCCGKSLKRVEPFYRREKLKGLEIIAINSRDPRGVVERYGSSNGITFSLLPDEHSIIAKEYRVFGLPTVIIVDRSGVIREKILGEVPAAKLENLVSRYLQATAAGTSEPAQGSRNLIGDSMARGGKTCGILSLNPPSYPLKHRHLSSILPRFFANLTLTGG